MKTFDELWARLAILIGNRFSLHRYFKKNKATAEVHRFTDPKETYRFAIKVKCRGMEYFFESEPKIETYKNSEGKEIEKTIWQYGGWGMDLTIPENKNPFNKFNP